MSEDAIPTELIKLIINTLGSDAITPKEQQLGYFICNKLQKLNTWDQWLAGETKQIDQFMNHGLFGSPMSRSELPADAVILPSNVAPLAIKIPSLSTMKFGPILI